LSPAATVSPRGERPASYGKKTYHKKGEEREELAAVVRDLIGEERRGEIGGQDECQSKDVSGKEESLCPSRGIFLQVKNK